MSDISPVALLYGPNGMPAVWQTNANTTNDASRSMIVTGGLEGDTARPLLLDSSGRQIVVGGAAAGAAVAGNPVLMGATDGTNAQVLKVFDLDTGAGTDYAQGVSIRLAASGGSVAGGTSTNPIRNEPAGTTPQRIYNPEGDSWGVGYNGRMRTGVDNLIISDLFSGAVINFNIWSATFSLVPAVSSGSVDLNSGSSTTTALFTNVLSRVYPELFGEFPLYMRFRAKASWRTNAIFEMGQMVAPDTSAAPSQGAFFRVNDTGTVSVVISFGGTETTITSGSSLDVTKWYDFQLEIMSHYVKWNIVDTAGDVFFTDIVNSVSVPLYPPATQSDIYDTATDRHMQVVLRQRHVGTVTPSAAKLSVSAVTVTQRDTGAVRNAAETAAGIGRGGYQGAYAGSSTTLAQTANHANSTSPTDATLSNTAAGYTTLGGRYSFAGRAGAATDFAIFAYLVQVRWRFVITGVTISAMNTGATVATTPTILDWSLGVGSSFVSLALNPKRIPLGMQGFKVGELAGAMAQDIVRIFPTPIICDSSGSTAAGGCYVHVILQVPTGTATASQKIRGDVMINGYFE